MKILSRASILALIGGASAFSKPVAVPAPRRHRTSSLSAEAAAIAEEVKLSISGHDIDAWPKGYTSCALEVPPTNIDIDLPSDFPAGTYYRNGHGCFESPDGQEVRHMFDADGMVIGVTFDPEKKQMLFRNRFVRTDGYVADQKSKMMTRPGIFGTKCSGGLLKNLFRTDFKNVANTHVLYRNDKLYALWEGGWPWVLDPLTLENDIVKEPFGHNLDGLLVKGQSFAAHYRYDAQTDNIVNFGYQLNPSLGETTVNLWEFDAQMQSIRSDPVSFVFKGAGVIHDFVITENWHVFVMPPAEVDNKKALLGLLGQGAFADVIGFDHDATESTVYLIPRLKDLDVGKSSEMRVGEDDRVIAIMVPYHFSFHFANAFEDEDGNVVIDSVLSDSVDLGVQLDPSIPVWEAVDLDELSPGRYDRLTVDPTGATKPKMETKSTREPEFPSIPRALSGKRHRYAYTVGAHKEYQPIKGKGKGTAGAVMKIDTEDPSKSEAFAFLPHEFVGEQVFVPKVGSDVTKRESEDEGYLVTLVENRRDLTTDLVLFDVEGRGSLEKGPVVRVPMPTWLPPGLHGTFVEGLSF